MNIKATVSIEDRCLVVADGPANKGGFRLRIPLYDLFETLRPEEKLEVAEALTWGPVLDEAIRRLTGQSQSWCGGDVGLTLDVLCKMEKRVTSGYAWGNLRGLERVCKDVTVHNHLYWKLFHDPEHGQWFANWADERGIDSNYTTELPDYEALEALVTQAFKDLRAGVACEALNQGSTQEGESHA